MSLSEATRKAEPPTPKPKPHLLRGNSLDTLDNSSHIDKISKPEILLTSPIPQRFPGMARDKENRLVIAIDYGTTFTGK